MKSVLLGLFVSMVSFQIFAANQITLGSYVAKNLQGQERMLLTLGAPGQPNAIPRLTITADIPAVGRITDNCSGTYGIRGDLLVANVKCTNSALTLFLGGSDITVAVNIAGATNAMMTTTGAPVSLNINDGTFESTYKLFRR